MNKKAKGWIIAAAVLAVLVAAVFGLKAWIGSSSPRGVINPIKGPVIHVEELSFFKGLDKRASISVRTSAASRSSSAAPDWGLPSPPGTMSAALWQRRA